MFQELGKQFLKKLNQILHSKYFYYFLLLTLSIYIIINVFIIKRTSQYNVQENSIKGKVLFYKIDGDKLSIILKAQEKVMINYYFKNEKEKYNYQTNFKINSLIYVEGSFKEPPKNTIPNTFNYKKYLYSQKIYILFEASNIKILKQGISLKNNFIRRINKFERKDYLYSFIIGDKSYLDMTFFQENGISHIFAISGMHVSFLVSFLEKRLKIKNSTFITIILWLYSYLVSFTVGVLRVVIFKTIKLMLNKCDIELKNYLILILTGSIMLLVNPFYIYNYGFLYSLIISLSIMLFEIKGKYFTSLLKISCISLLFSLPITISLNYQINIFSIFNNLLFIPLVTFIIFPLSLITFAIPILEPILNIILAILDFINKNLPVINLVMPKLSFIVIIIYYLNLLLFIKFRKKVIIALILIIILANKYKYLLNNTMDVYFLDVQQGDTSLIIYPKRKKVVMIDCGGKIKYSKEKWRFKKKEYNLVDNFKVFFNSLGISKIDVLIISHGDYDHMGEAINLVNNFKVEKVIFNCGEFNELEKDLIKVLDKKKIKYYSCISELNIDKNKLYFLQTKEYDNENDFSNVIYTELDGYKFMFMGDASSTTEKEILNKYNLPDIDVLKVGHHGSKTSSNKEFINEINPKYSIISVGENNRYGHPNKEVLDNLEKSKIYRTDEDGSIMFKIKNNKFKTETCGS